MKDIKFSCLPLSIYDQFYNGNITISQFSKMAHEMGYDGIDINEYFVKDMSIHTLNSLKNELEIPVVGMCAYSDFTNRDSSIIDNEINRALENITKAAAVGAQYVRLTAGPAYPYCNNDTTIDLIYDCFSQCIEEASKLGIKIVLENHLKALSWEHLDYNFDYERILLLWEKLKRLSVSINFDTANSYALGNWQGLLNVLLDRIETLHINDIASMEPFECSVAGEGIVCIKDMLQIIFNNGFTGWITIEEAGFQGTEGMSRAIKNMRSLCSEL